MPNVVASRAGLIATAVAEQIISVIVTIASNGWKLKLITNLSVISILD